MATNAVEAVSKDVLDKNFINSFRFTLRFQTLIGTCRVNPKELFITSPTKFQKLYSIVLIILTTIMHYIIAVYYYSPAYFNSDKRLYCLELLSTAVNFLVFFLNMIHVRFHNIEKNSQFYFHLQKIDRIMNMKTVRFIYNTLPGLNIFSTVTVLVVIIFLTASSLAVSGFKMLPFLGMTYSNFSFLYEIMYCSNILVYFIIRIRFMNAIMENHLDPDNAIIFTITKPIITMKNMRCAAARTHDYATNDLYAYLKELLDGFQKFQDIYKFQVLLFCIKQIFVGVVSFQYFILLAQAKALDVWDTLVQLWYPVGELFILLFVCGRCEIFIRNVKNTKRLCIGVMALYQEGPLREKARQMYKMLEEHPQHFSVYDIWNMDAYSFLKIVSILTTSFVTLLQFALL